MGAMKNLLLEMEDMEELLGDLVSPRVQVYPDLSEEEPVAVIRVPVEQLERLQSALRAAWDITDQSAWSHDGSNCE